MEKNKRALAIFDFDGTMIRGDSIVGYVRLAVRQKRVSVWRFCLLALLAIPYYLGLLTDEQYKNRGLQFYGRMTPDERQEMDGAYAAKTLLPRVYADARKRLEERKKEGCLCLLVSASTENYMRFVADGLGFDALLCTPLGTDGKIGINCKGEEKTRRLREYLDAADVTADFAASYAYGDSRSDLPVLRLCGRAALVNPKRALRRAAPRMAAQHWQ